MRLKVVFLLVAGAAWSARVHAVVVDPVVIDFEDIDLGMNSSLNVGPSLAFPNAGNTGVNVTIVGGQPFLHVEDLSSYPGATGQALLDYSFSAHVTTILFDRPVANFRMDAGDLGADDDTPLVITAYDAGDNVLGSDSVPWPVDQAPPFATLSVNAVGIRKILYSSGGDLPNSTYIDNLSFTPVPEPTADMLLGSVAVGAAAFPERRRRRRTLAPLAG